MKIRCITTILLFLFILISYGQKFALKDSAVKNGDILVTHHILFAYTSASIKSESFIFLDSMLTFVLQHKKLVLEIGQHCDERWSENYSTCLTCMRAKAIADYLITKGVSSERLISIGYNDSKPLIQNAKTEEEHHINRRTEFKIIKTDYNE